MLILTRKVGEIIHIGDDIIVIVKSVSGKTVRLGVVAPSEVPIYREELLAAQREKRNANRSHSSRTNSHSRGHSSSRHSLQALPASKD